MSVDSKPIPIPAFYCCYLLRSIVLRTALYIGSTPNPPRRLAQHNGGLSHGGAARTAHLKPWEMACLVSGFPSNIAALQFEWAWQNPHLTKKIAEEQRLTARTAKAKYPPATGRKQKRKRKRPPTSLKDRLSNLHLLLRVSSFARWPLEVRFFCEDVHDVWLRSNASVTSEINTGVKVVLDPKQPPAESLDEREILNAAQVKRRMKREAIGKGGVEGVDIGYSRMRNHVEKSLSLLAEGETNRCAICETNIGPLATTVLVCPQENCRAVSHMACLAQHFLCDTEHQSESVLPTSGKCPLCKSELQWIDLVKEMSLRVRGEAEVAKLMKKPRVRKAKILKGKEVLSTNVAAEITSDETDEDDNRSPADEVLETENEVEDQLPDDWHLQEDSSDGMSVASATSDVSSCLDPTNQTKPIGQAPRLEIVIEDSDWYDADLLG